MTVYYLPEAPGVSKITYMAHLIIGSVLVVVPGIVTLACVICLVLHFKAARAGRERGRTAIEALQRMAPSPSRGTRLRGIASTPGLFELDIAGLKRIHPEADAEAVADVEAHIKHGDCDPAAVVAEEPLLIAVYVSEFDSNVYLVMDEVGTEILRAKGKAKEGTKLISANTYMAPGAAEQQKDVRHGPKSYRRYIGVWPIIVELVSNDSANINRVVALLGQERYEHCWALAAKDMDAQYSMVRLGQPLMSVMGGMDFRDRGQEAASVS
jgi:hypothetical protein